MKRATPLMVLLIPLLLFVAGFAPGLDMDEQDVRERASFVPRLEEYYSKPTVETSASYDPDSDAWRVVLREEVSDEVVASLNVADDSGEVSGVEVSLEADEIEYPALSEDDAIKIAAADEEVREELSRHGPYSTAAEYEDGEWIVHFYVDETGVVGGRPTEEGKEIAVAGVDDATWVLNYVHTGDQVGWLMARGEPGAYGKQANYWWVW
ncbi:MAG TPA: hypothetical protein VGP38_04920, partial [Rubrobacter sp.]|nr:hypothetical protein [Rubrobacter sp.]